MRVRTAIEIVLDFGVRIRTVEDYFNRFTIECGTAVLILDRNELLLMAEQVKHNIIPIKITGIVAQRGETIS